jgi:carbon monoxide dehydrogenase subunit G
MKLEQSFEVAAPLERVWEALIDVERVAPCLPGAAITGRNDDGSYNGTFKVKIGPTSAAYTGKLAMQEIDESSRTATMDAQGTDKKGQGGAKATIVSRVREADNGATHVEVVTDYHITGRLARFGRGGMIEDISNKLLGTFANCLQTSLAGDGGAAAEAAPAEPAPAEAAPAEATPAEAAPAEATPAEAASAEAAPAEATPAAEESGPAPAAGEEAPAPGEAEAAPAPIEAKPEAEAAPPAPEAPKPPPPPAPAPPPPPPPSPAAAPMPESEPVQGLSLMGGALWGRAKRNPAPLVALMLGFLLAIRVLRRRR